jgi:hypothetical protein
MDYSSEFGPGDVNVLVREELSDDEDDGFDYGAPIGAYCFHICIPSSFKYLNMLIICLYRSQGVQF